MQNQRSSKGGSYLLLVEADPARAAAWAEALQGWFPTMAIHAVPTPPEAGNADLAQSQAVIAALRGPDADAPQWVSRLHAQHPDLPIVLVAEPGQLPAALQALNHGATDYLLTSGSYLQALPVIVQRAIAHRRAQCEHRALHAQLTRTLTQVRQKNQRLEHVIAHLRSAAGTDPLTGLANRRSFGQALEQRFAEAKRHGRDLACLMLDLDQFKQLNDAAGHPAGDRVLEALGRVLEACCRRSDAAGRFGGDEFIVLLPETDIATARQVAQRIRDQFNQAMQSEPECFSHAASLTMSQGLASVNDARTATAEQLVACADEALYHAKNAGGNRLHVYQPRPNTKNNTRNTAITPPRPNKQSTSQFIPNQI